MQTPLRLTFRHCDHSDALQVRARELTARLERFHDRILDCHAVIAGPSSRHTKGGKFTVTLEIAVAGSIINATTAHAPCAAHVDPYVALRDAFASAKRQLRHLAMAS